MRRRGHRDVERGLQIRLVETREHPFGIGGFELRIQIHLVVDRVDEPVQSLAGVGVAAVRVDHQHVVLRQPGQRDPGRLVVTRHVEFAVVEHRPVDTLGGDVDERVGTRHRVERDGGHRPEGTLTGVAGTVGQVEVDAVTVHGDQASALGGLVAGEVGKCHAVKPSGPAAGASEPREHTAGRGGC